jgi:hypothetical protein
VFPLIDAMPSLVYLSSCRRGKAEKVSVCFRKW